MVTLKLRARRNRGGERLLVGGFMMGGSNRCAKKSDFRYHESKRVREKHLEELQSMGGTLRTLRGVSNL